MNRINRVWGIVILVSICPFIHVHSQNIDQRSERERSIFLPASDTHYRVVRNYIEDTPHFDYVHASEEAYEAFRDIKFAMMILKSIRPKKGGKVYLWGYKKMLSTIY